MSAGNGGRGPRPKDPSKRARRNVDPKPTTTVALKRAAQPKLPKAPEFIGEWPEQTVRWWKTWGEVALTDLFTKTDWDFLLDTAIVHAYVWQGELRWAAELRLRVSKFGATTEDRARLRIAAETNEDEDGKGEAANAVAPPEYGRMRVVADGA